MTTYQQQLADKVARFTALLAPFVAPLPEVFACEARGYRLRAEFRIWHDADGVHYVMVEAGQRASAATVVKIAQLPIACAAINALMPRLLAALQADAALHRKLFQCEFLSTLAGDMLVSLIYHRRLDEAWQQKAQALAQELGIAVIGRSRGQKIVLSRDYVEETLTVCGREWHYRQYEGAFTQPNGRMCEQMLAWACTQAGDDGRDLLELYAGNGNFTLPLSRHFRSVLATEISKSGIRALRENVAANGVDNIRLARLSAADLYLMDEPFKGVDARTERIIVDLLKHLKGEGKTVVVVHHDLHTVRSYFDRAVLLNLRLITAGPTDEVFTEENIRRTYRSTETLLEENA